MSLLILFAGATNDQAPVILQASDQNIAFLVMKNRVQVAPQKERVKIAPIKERVKTP